MTSNMADFNIRTDAVDVEQIMRQIRARIKRSAASTTPNSRFRSWRTSSWSGFSIRKACARISSSSSGATRYEARGVSARPELRTGFDAEMLYGTHRGILRLIRRLLNPILKLFFNPNTLDSRASQAVGRQHAFEAQFQFLRQKTQQREEVDVLYYELVHNLVLELTRVGIENRNLKMRLESLSSRMDFDERRARALEDVVQYRPGTGPAREPQQRRRRPPQDERPVPSAGTARDRLRRPHQSAAAAPRNLPMCRASIARSARRRAAGRRRRTTLRPGPNRTRRAAGAAAVADAAAVAGARRGEKMARVATPTEPAIARRFGDTASRRSHARRGDGRTRPDADVRRWSK